MVGIDLAVWVAGGAGELVRIVFVGIDDSVAVGIHLADEVGAVGTRRDRVGDAVDVRACEIDEAGPVTADIIGEGHAGVVSRDRGVLRSLGAGESLVALVGVLGIGVAALEGMRTDIGLQPVLGGQAELVAVAPAERRRRV